MNTKTETDVIHLEGDVGFDKNKLKRVYLNQVSTSRTGVILFLSRAMPAFSISLLDLDNEDIKTKAALLLKSANDTALLLCGIDTIDESNVLEYFNLSENALLCVLEALPLLKKHSKTFQADCPDNLYTRVIETAENLLYSLALLEISHPPVFVFECPGCDSCQPDMGESTEETPPPKTNSVPGRALH